MQQQTTTLDCSVKGDRLVFSATPIGTHGRSEACWPSNSTVRDSALG